MVFDVWAFLRVPVFQNLTQTTNIVLKTYMDVFAFGSQMNNISFQERIVC